MNTLWIIIGLIWVLVLCAMVIGYALWRDRQDRKARKEIMIEADKAHAAITATAAANCHTFQEDQTKQNHEFQQSLVDSMKEAFGVLRVTVEKNSALMSELIAVQKMTAAENYSSSAANTQASDRNTAALDRKSN